MTHDLLQIMTTTETSAEAQRIATQLIESRFAACVQIDGPIQSVYRWQGKVESGQEYRCTVKTTEQHLPSVQDVIQRLHSYDVPEIIVVPIVHASQAYADWLREAVTPDRSRSDSE